VRQLLIASLLVIGLGAVARADSVVRRDHVVVTYEGVDERLATAVADVVEAARKATADLGFDMPRTVAVNVSARPTGGAGLFNDGDRSIFLTVRSEKDFRRPTASGVFVIYGLCHEVGHLAMYRAVKDRRWMTTAAAEGWAHYLGSRLVDAVHAARGEDMWPDKYDYREDGTKRLKRQRDEARPSPTVRGAALWTDLVEQIGDKGVVETFAAWGRAKIDPADPGKALGAGLPAGDAVRKWWTTAGPVFLTRSPVSPFGAKAAKPADLTGKPRELAHDDGKSAGMRSFAGGGHAIWFDVPDGDWYLSTVSVFGARYGTAEAPEEKFTVFLLDEQLGRIAEFPFAYARFERGDPKWVELGISPTRVPRKFVVGVDFQPTARKGVYVHHDARRDGHSSTGVPGGAFQTFRAGDWMIRAKVDRLKEAK
jgi:hypothetical protein